MVKTISENIKGGGAAALATAAVLSIGLSAAGVARAQVPGGSPGGPLVPTRVLPGQKLVTPEQRADLVAEEGAREQARASARPLVPMSRDRAAAAIAEERARIRAYPNAKVDVEAYRRAIEHRSKMRPANFVPRTAPEGPKPAVPVAPRPSQGGSAGSGVMRFTDGTNITYTDIRWTPFGPRYMTPGFRPSHGPNNSYVSGRVNGVAFTNKQPGVAYAAAAGGGAWVMNRVGGFGAGFPVTWRPLGDAFPVPQTSSVAVDPVNSRILYVGLGDFNGATSLNPSFTNGLASGIMKSTNGGNTWFNVGNPQLAGVAVSSIVVDPDNPKIVIATTGRGTSPGGIWRSVDSGTTWTNVTPAGVQTDWGVVRIFNPYNRPRTTGTRYYFAAAHNDGVYRSSDRGATWVKLNPPLRYNLPGIGPLGLASLRVEVSAVDRNTIYIMDSNSLFSDGKLFRGVRNPGDTDAAPSYTWTEITGDYPTSDGIVNNWFRSDYASLLTAVPVTVADPGDPFNLVTTDLLYGGNSTLSAALFGDRDWENVTVSSSGASESQNQQHALEYNPFQPVEQLFANDAGVYGLFYNPDLADLGFVPWQFEQQLNGDGDPTTVGAPKTDPENAYKGLLITQFNGADWHPTDPLQMTGGTQNLGLARATGLNSWESVGTITSGGGAGSGFPVGPYTGNVAIDPSFPGTQVTTMLEEGGSTAWQGGRSWILTQDNWATAIDISPDQFVQSSMGNLYFFPFNGTTDGSVGPAFAGQAQALFPTLAFDVSPDTDFETGVTYRPLYTGTNAVWRYDIPPAAAPNSSATSPRGVLGRWRPVGTTQLTTNGTVTAIAVAPGTGGGRIYAGTSDGQIWVTTTVNGIDSGRRVNAMTLAIEATWRSLKVPSLPDRAITSINVSPTNPGDILVTLSGTGTGHVLRCADTTARSIIFTEQSGIGYPGAVTSLPDVPANGIERDPNDPDNTWFVATDIGVFTTTDQGSTWSDATSPLGLPNVEVTRIKAIPGTGLLNVATYGRGAWRFDLNAAVEKRVAPRLSISYTLTRSGSELVAVVTVVNAASTPANPVGVADNVQITASAIQALTTAGTTTALPVRLGSIGAGTSKSVALRFPGSVARSGSSATFQVTYNYTGATNPVNYSNRTRLP